MIRRCKVAARRAAGVFLLASIMLALATPSASAQGVFDTILGAFKNLAPRQVAPQMSYAPQTNTLAVPLAPTGLGNDNRSSGDVGGHWVAYCVRLCDGRYFPLSRSFSQSPAGQCRSFCPTAKTKVFGGNSINNAAAVDGSRYANLDNAFVYRTRLVDNCTCNGRDAFGIARMDVAADPTLRTGDIVAVSSGFVAYTGARPAAKQASDFTPIAQYAGLSSEARRKLSETKVLPSRQLATPMPAPALADNKPAWRDDRRAQLVR